MRFAGELAFLFVLVSGCGPEPITEVFACYGVDEPLRRPGGSVELSVTSSDGTQILYQSEIGDLSLERATHGYVQDQYRGVLLTLTARIPDPAGMAEDQVIEQRAQVAFQVERVVDVSLRIEQACVATLCGPAETCVGGACVSMEVEAGCLADHDAAAPPGCSDPRTTRGCIESP